MSCFVNSNGDVFTSGWSLPDPESNPYYPTKINEFYNSIEVKNLSCGN